MPSLRRTAAVAASLLVPLLAGCGPIAEAQPDASSATTVSAAPGPAASGEGVPLADAIADLKMTGEQRDGYDRDEFHHWIDADGDGCDTRDEVLLEEAVEIPKQGEDCDLSGGIWQSLYDGEAVTDSSDLDIDHMVPLAEAWDSGAHGWDAEQREKFANDLGEPGPTGRRATATRPSGCRQLKVRTARTPWTGWERNCGGGCRWTRPSRRR